MVAFSIATTETAADWRTWSGRNHTVEDGALTITSSEERTARRPQRGDHGAVAVGRFDAGERAVQWHRLALERTTPANTQVRLRYRASDDSRVVSGGLTTIEGVDDAAARALSAAGFDSVLALSAAAPAAVADALDDYSTTTVEEWWTAADTAIESAAGRWPSVGGSDPADVLLPDARGRYLCVALELFGAPRAAPRVQSLQAFCPRDSYQRHLPELYHSEEWDFLDQLLSVFESSHTDLERDIETLTAYLDPYGVPAAALEWLAGWLGVDERPEWPESARRERLARASELSSRRGTRAGLEAVLDIYLRHATSADHDYRVFCVEPAALDGLADGPACPYSRHLDGPRSVVVFAGPLPSDRHRTAVERIVSEETPAHVRGTVVPLTDGVELAGNTFLGINSRLTERELALDETTLGDAAALADRRATATDI